MCVLGMAWDWFLLGVKNRKIGFEEAWNEFLLCYSGASPIRKEWPAVAPISRGMGSLGRGGLRSESRR